MYTSHCLMHVGQLQLPIQHRVRAAALQVYAAVQQGQGASRQPVRKQQRSGSTRRQQHSKGGFADVVVPQQAESPAAHSQQQQQQSSQHIPEPVVEQQQAGQPGYVADTWDMPEPWEQQQGYVAEPWLQQQEYVPEPWEQHVNATKPLQLSPDSNSRHLTSHTAPGSTSAMDPGVDDDLKGADGWPLGAEHASADADVSSDAGEADDDVLWLLEDDSDDEQQQDQEDDETDGWIDDSTTSSSPQPTAAQRYARQQLASQGQTHQHQYVTEQQGTATEQLHAAGGSGSFPDLQVAWDEALQAAIALLASYDVRYGVPRQPPFSSSDSHRRVGPGTVINMEDVSLTAAAAAAAAKTRHTRRRQTVTGSPVPYLPDVEQDTAAVTATVAAGTDAAQTDAQQQQQRPSAAPVLPDDPRWQSVQRTHAAYLTYMQQLSAMVVSKQQQTHQIVYQVGICEHWLQLAHILAVFEGPELSPAVTAAMWKRLTGIITRKVFSRMSHAEKCNYDIFVDVLAQQSITSISQHCTDSSSPVSSRPVSSMDDAQAAVSCSPSQLAATVYSMAVLGVSSIQLTSAVIEAASVSLMQAAAEVQAAVTEEPPLQQSGSQPSIPLAGVRQQPVSAGAAAVCGWGPSEVAMMMWGLGTMGGYKPDQHWLEQVAVVSGHLLSRCQPSQLWGVLWGFSRLGHSPPEPWLASWLAAARQQLDGFNADALSHSIWALATLQYTPDKLWLRAFSGMMAHRIRSLAAGHLSLALPALSSLGYKPRAELCRTIIAQARRHLHTFKASQLCSVLLSLASYPPAEGAAASTSSWHPGRLFLFDFVTHSSPPGVMQAWTGDQASQVLWAFSRFRYVPDRSYLKALLSHIQSQLPACTPDGLSMALWGLAALKQQLPSRAWGEAWCDAALRVADGFSPQALAHGLSAMAALNIKPAPQLMQALTRTASGCLPGCSCMELGLLIAALADLHWRPSDVWMTAFVSQVSQQLPAFENEDYGLLLYGLASLAQPLQPTLLARLCTEVKSKLYGLSGEGLGLLVWGIAQYDIEMRDANEWWAAVFKEFESKWESTTLRGCALAVVGLSQMGPRHLPPGTWEAGFITRYKTLTISKPRSWPELLMGLRAAAGLEVGEQLVITPWMDQLLLQLGRSWNLPDPQEAGGLAAVSDQVIAAAAVLRGERGTEATSAAAVSLQLDGGRAAAVVADDVAHDAEGFVEVALIDNGVEPTSATAVLL